MPQEKIPVWIYEPSYGRVAYLLADAGIALFDSIKGSSIHARSMITAFHREGCFVDVYTMRLGDMRAKPPWKVQEVKQGALTRWWKNKFIKGKLWRRFPFKNKKDSRNAKNEALPNWVDGVAWLLWHRDFYRHTIKRLRLRPPMAIYARHAWLAFPYAKLARKLGVPLWLEVNAVMSVEKAVRGEAAFARLGRRIERKAFEAADQILPVSQEIKDQIVAMFGIDPAKIVVTPNAVDLSLFKPAKGAAAPLADPAKFVVCGVNSFRDYHGNVTLMRAVALLREEIPGLKLLLVGAGPKFKRDKAMAAEIGIDDIAEFTGVVDHAEVPRRMREADVCVAPYEGEVNQYNCPMKLFEYVAAGVPIVATQWGDIPNTIEHGRTGLLCAPGDPAALAEALRQVWREPDAARERARAALRGIYAHTWQSVAQRVLGRPLRHPTENFDPVAVELARTQEHETFLTEDARFRALQPHIPYVWKFMPPDHLPNDGSVEIPAGCIENAYLPGAFATPAAVDEINLHHFKEKQIADAAVGDPVTPTLEARRMQTQQAGFWGAVRHHFYNACLRLGTAMACLLPEPRPARADGRPLRILRMSSRIAHGGVAKVCLQSTLASDPALVHYKLLAFNEKQACLGAVQDYPHIAVSAKLLELWPGNYDFRFFRDVWRLSKIIRAERPDVVHIHEPQFVPAVLAASKLARCGRVVAQMHNDYNVRHQSMDEEHFSMYLACLRRVPVIACSQTIYNAARVLLEPMRRPIVKIIDGVDDRGQTSPEPFLVERLRAVAGDRKILIMLAHLKPHKRVEDFMMACRLLMDDGYPIFCLPVCYGKTNDARRFRIKFNAMFEPEEGEFLYQVRNPQYLLPEAAVGVSTSCIEGLGLNILELQCAAVPVVCTDLFPHKEMVEDEVTGLFFAAGDVAGLARQLRRILEDPALGRRLGEAGKRRAEERHWTQTAEETATFYRKVLSADS